MEIVWNNPNPSRTLDRPLIWEVLARDGTPRVISAAEIQTMVHSNLLLKEVRKGSHSLLLLGFCF